MRLSRPEVLSRDEIAQIHEASLNVLWNTGLIIDSEKALKILKEAGATVDFKEKLTKIPRHLIEEALKSAPSPSKVILYDRSGRPSLKLGNGDVYAFSGFNATYVLDAETGKRRAAAKKDIADFSKLADALKNIHAVGNQAIPQDVPPRSSELHAFEALLNNTEKHIFFCPTSRVVADAVFEMAKAVIGNNDLATTPILSCQASSTSPLRWEAGAIEVLIEAAKNGIMCNVLGEPITGATAPVTLAGTLVIYNAENLSGVLISQLVRRGTPVMYGCAPTIFDMREATPIISAPEAIIMRIASAQLAKFYGLPSHSISPDTDAHCHDEQNAWEKALTTMVALSSGIDIVVNAGMFATGLTVSYEQLVIDNEILGLLFRVLKGIDVNPETLALDLIKKVKPGGHFLKEMHTLKHLRTEHWMPDISTRSAYGRWIELGGKDVVKKAGEKVKEILQQHEPRRLDHETQIRLKEIIKKFEEQT